MNLTHLGACFNSTKQREHVAFQVQNFGLFFVYNLILILKRVRSNITFLRNFLILGDRVLEI